MENGNNFKSLLNQSNIMTKSTLYKSNNSFSNDPNASSILSQSQIQRNHNSNGSLGGGGDAIGNNNGSSH